MTEPLIAHTKNKQGVRHSLLDHLQGAAELAANFAKPLYHGLAVDFIKAVTMAHDLGKANPAFQQYLYREEQNPTKDAKGPDHKATGCYYFKTQGGLGTLAGMLIQAHHGGLHNPAVFRSWFQEKERNYDQQKDLDILIPQLDRLRDLAVLKLPLSLSSDRLTCEFFLRMAFSCLVDADALDTEAHFKPGKAEVRQKDQAIISQLWQVFQADQQALQQKVLPGTVMQLRRDLYQTVVKQSDLVPGLYRLTLPTGAGKTRTAMAFALAHALKHNLERIIVAVPFTTVTEQTADTYRSIFAPLGTDVILEHHSAIDEERSSKLDLWHRLAAENWDAPITVTTTVQLFESIFARNSSKMRKLHNLANAVIIIDEAQSLPVNLLVPLLDSIKQLVKDYHTTVILTTATQPAFDLIRDFASLGGIELISNLDYYFKAFARVQYNYLAGLQTIDQLAAQVQPYPQVLAVLNTRKSAAALYRTLEGEGNYYLSTFLCPAHRRVILRNIKSRLADQLPCRVVSTQLIEAGVDLDFPVVYRAYGPLDSIIQAAGRCNREGLLANGQVTIFELADEQLPSGNYRLGTTISKGLLQQGVNPDDLQLLRTYFSKLYTLNVDRGEKIQKDREQLDYEEVAKAVKLIKEESHMVIVPYGTKWSDLLKKLVVATDDLQKWVRLLQPYSVSLLSGTINQLLVKGLIGEVTSGVYQWLGRYDDQLGIIFDD